MSISTTFLRPNLSGDTIKIQVQGIAIVLAVEGDKSVIEVLSPKLGVNNKNFLRGMIESK